MLILKGENGKSEVVNIILDSTISACFVYNDCPLAAIKNSIWLDSRQYTLEHLKLCMVQETRCKEYYDYLIVYTNEKESDLKDFIGWLKMTFTYRNIIVACK